MTAAGQGFRNYQTYALDLSIPRNEANPFLIEGARGTRIAFAPDGFYTLRCELQNARGQPAPPFNINSGGKIEGVPFDSVRITHQAYPGKTATIFIYQDSALIDFGQPPPAELSGATGIFDAPPAGDQIETAANLERAYYAAVAAGAAEVFRVNNGAGGRNFPTQFELVNPSSNTARQQPIYRSSAARTLPYAYLGSNTQGNVPNTDTINIPANSSAIVRGLRGAFHVQIDNDSAQTYTVGTMIIHGLTLHPPNTDPAETNVTGWIPVKADNEVIKEGNNLYEQHANFSAETFVIRNSTAAAANYYIGIMAAYFLSKVGIEFDDNTIRYSTQFPAHCAYVIVPN